MAYTELADLEVTLWTCIRSEGARFKSRSGKCGDSVYIGYRQLPSDSSVILAADFVKSRHWKRRKINIHT
jgi:hypothetical protein